MQFYLAFFIDTGLTLSDLGEWEDRSVAEMEAYLWAYVRKLKDTAKAQKKAGRKTKPRSISR